MTSPCATWEVRWSENQFDGHEDVITALDGIAKHYVFQLEEADGGYLHYQGRISLIKKRRQKEKHILLKLFPEGTAPQYCEPTTNPEHTKGFSEVFYQMKADTRKAGAWTDKDEKIYIPRQVREMEGLRPFQQSIIDDADKWDTRTINIVYCEHGNLGKSRLVSYCRAHRLGRSIPPVNDYQQIMRAVYCVPTSKLYLFDMPRSQSKTNIGDFFAGIETVKDGYAYDDRHVFKEKVFDCPNIWIFTNQMPNMKYLSQDRWKVWTITHDTYELTEL